MSEALYASLRSSPKTFRDSLRSSQFGGMWVDAFRLIEISLDGWRKYEDILKKGLLLLAKVASGNEKEGDCVSWGEFNIILDIVQPELSRNMRVSLFHAFSEAAIRKEGRNWEGEALAEVLLRYGLELER